nr:hypothetical protein BaRGS_000878 [Batillaria attramentaria]
MLGQRFSKGGRMLASNILILWIITLLCQVTSQDICSLGSESDVSDLDFDSIIFDNSVPKGAKNAGRFHKARQIDRWEDCVVVCCVDEECNLVYFFNNTCYLIQCNLVDGAS